MKIKDVLLGLITKNDGKISHDKLWSNVASFVLCILFPWHVLKTGNLDTTAMLTFAGIFIARVTASGLIDIQRSKQKGNKPDE